MFVLMKCTIVSRVMIKMCDQMFVTALIQFHFFWVFVNFILSVTSTDLTHFWCEWSSFQCVSTTRRICFMFYDGPGEK